MMLCRASTVYSFGLTRDADVGVIALLQIAE